MYNANTIHPLADVHSLTNGRYSALDGIRGIAALIVAFVWHYQHFSPEIYPFSKILYWPYHFCWIMVDLFFILSGFIFFNVYGERIKNGKLSLKEFAVLRFSRLYPLHWLALIIVFVIQVLRKILNFQSFLSTYSLNIGLFLLNIPMLQNGWITTTFSYNGPSWSISIEIIMYLLFFAVFYHSRFTKKYVIYCFLLIYLGIIMTFSGQNTAFFNGQVSRGLMGFFIGCITGEVCNYCSKNKKHELIFTVFCSIAVIFLIIFPIVYGYGILRNWVLVYTFAFFPAFVFLTIRMGALSWFFSIKPFIYLGNLSYSIYLLHYPVQLIIKTLDEFMGLNINYSSKIFYLVYIITVITISHFVYYCFEKPMQKIIRKKYKAKYNGA
jgi:peptidoglycan/LPS O-acetylase OafA/YrhL